MRGYTSLHEAWHQTLKRLGVFGPEWRDQSAPPRAAVNFYNKGGELPLRDAEEFLIELLSNGKLKAVGRQGDDISIIPNEFWEYGEVRWDQNDIVYDFKTIAQKITVKQSDLERELEKQARPLDTISRRRECFEWLARQMRESPKFRPKPHKEFFAEAQKMFGISERAFSRQWSEAIDNTGANWNKGGRPRKTIAPKPPQ